MATAMAGEESSESRAGAALASPKSAATAAQQTGGLIVGYKPKAPQAHSDKAVREDTQAIAAQAGEKLSYDRRLGTGAALVDLGGVQPAKDVAVLMDRFRADPDVAYVVPDRQVQAVKSQDVAGTGAPDRGDTRTGDGDLLPEQSWDPPRLVSCRSTIRRWACGGGRRVAHVHQIHCGLGWSFLATQLRPARTPPGRHPRRCHGRRPAARPRTHGQDLAQRTHWPARHAQ
ncbi:hypothetical protein [Streptomyces lunaelactis]|uniref:hypothetical protein n=1 Tax=Streptomyces lunaelactis TaxID=1535768 RepID=UPI00131F06FA|nr:hypothetical protein [Streptomyces lunaelactis]NUK85944.1 hypothetical protein [Streptomyces lunaelactis]